ncbi:uncharacterized protein LOC108910395 [Anoplophora glabripennis]|uniref:uncharacterized protein LOC108910395 n=1 Tax=Anoplophora glabripennis TaxID=217634 RepID=UPI0008742C12|nr:uncharacterized protein LOC108910395 [Anoplophora glabripennis]
MTSKVTLLIWFIALCSFLQEAYGDDDDYADTNLPLTNVSFTFTDEDIVIKWDLMSETNCSVEYHFTVRDSELGVILDEYLEDQFMRLDAISPCITYNVGIQVVSKASPATKGPLLTITIQLYPRAQIAPALKSLDVQSTSINVSWLLEGNKNRCPLKNFYVNDTIYRPSSNCTHPVLLPSFCGKYRGMVSTLPNSCSDTS